MADFCRQCYSEVLGLDPERNDMAGKITEEQYQQGYVGIGICEGCGGGEFGPDGTCLGCEIGGHPHIESPSPRET